MLVINFLEILVRTVFLWLPARHNLLNLTGVTKLITRITRTSSIHLIQLLDQIKMEILTVVSMDQLHPSIQVNEINT